MLWLCNPLIANNLRISGLRLEGRETLALDIAWDHAWNMTGQSFSGHDAVWLFVKVRENGLWRTQRLSTFEGESQSENPAVLQTKAAADGMGIFALPAFEGAGEVPETVLRLKLMAPLGDGVSEIQVFGIEMAWVGEGAFWLGDGASVNALHSGGAPYFVDADGELSVGNAPGELDGSDEFAPASHIPAEWPAGYDGFYCMKYEVSQAQYADFLNCLTPEQQRQRTGSGPDASPNTFAMGSGAAFRNGIHLYQPSEGERAAAFACDGDGDGSYNGIGDGQHRACNFLSWSDLVAYLDWAGLSPMTEFEYEKAARGPLMPVPLEFAWGTDEVVDANSLLQDGHAGESVAENPVAPAGLASHGYAGPQGPLRGGFGAHAASSRLGAGSGYWGLFELSGNLWEQCVSVNAPGLAFAGSNGDGSLDVYGNADQMDWPEAEGAIFRGGGWNSGILPGFRDLAVSDRFYAGQAPLQRRNTVGGRGVRR